MRPHDVLGVRPGASRAELAEAYRRHALQHHPDRGGDRAVFEAGAEAYRQLTGGASGRGPAAPPAAPPANIVFHRRRRPITALLRLARNRRSAPRSLS